MAAPEREAQGRAHWLCGMGEGTCVLSLGSLQHGLDKVLIVIAVGQPGYYCVIVSLVSLLVPGPSSLRFPIGLCHHQASKGGQILLTLKISVTAPAARAGRGLYPDTGAQAPVAAWKGDEGCGPGVPKDSGTTPSAWNRILLPGKQA